MTMPDSDYCPLEIQKALSRYVYDFIPTGGFLRAVLENDLKEAIGRADYKNIELLPHIVAFCYNNIPSASWGSPEKVESWLEGGK